MASQKIKKRNGGRRRHSKRLRLPWNLTNERVAPPHRVVMARDTKWLQNDGRVRQDFNARYEVGGLHSHWRWGSPTHWRPLTPAEHRAMLAIDKAAALF